jgi:hypothetical protein
MEKPKMKNKVGIKILKGFFKVEISSIDKPEIIERYTGKRGRTQGEKNVKKPPKNANAKFMIISTSRL